MSLKASPSAEMAARTIPIVPIAELESDPHRVYGRYRPETPFIARPDGSYIALRARDVESLITDPRTRQMEADLIKLRGITSGPLYDAASHSMLYSNGEAHRRRRGPMSRAFAFRIIEALRPRIRAVADQLIEDHAGAGRMSLLDDYASLIPARTIAAILGMPDEDIPHFSSLVYMVSKITTFSFTPEQVPAMSEAAQQLNAYAQKLLDERRKHPRDDFLTAFVQAVDEQGELSAVEILSQVTTVIVGGSDTTRAGIAVLVSLLLEHPDQWRAVCDAPSLIPGAVAEAVRYEPPVGSMPRFASADIEIDGYTVPGGSILTLSTMSAMRDPALYADPERFDIRRTDHPRWHLGFGGGMHRCIGEALAKVELEEALGALAARLPQLERDGEPLRVEGHSGIRRPSAFDVAWAH